MKLEGLRVLDLSRFLPGPFLSLMLSDHGAEVLSIEPPGIGEPSRQIGPRCGGESVWFRNTHRGKRSIVLDLKSDEGRAQFLSLAQTADVIVEGFRPGGAKRLGIDYATVSRSNPGIVYVAISAYGQTGPLADVPAHAAAIEARAGVLSLNVGHDGRPTLPHMPVADITGAMMGLAGVLMALYRRHATGKGDYIDISMHDSTLSWLPHSIGPVFAEQRAPEPKQERSWGGHSFNQIYETADARFIVLCGTEEKFIRNLLVALERPDLVAPALTVPGPTHNIVKSFLAEAFRKRTRDDWTGWFEGRDIGFSPLLDLHEAFDEPQVRERDMIINDAQGYPQLGNPIRFTKEPASIDTSVPRYGEHSAQFTPNL